jgi:hypothetical protein
VLNLQARAQSSTPRQTVAGISSTH